MHALVTGGAGFVGSHLVDALLERGHRVRVYDSLDPQVHPGGASPAHLSKEAQLVVGDMRDCDALREALRGVNVVFHQAAVVGVGQSMYQVRRYAEHNTVGGATLLDLLANERHAVEKVIVASSMSVYGEGSTRCAQCGVVAPVLRMREQLLASDWELRCPWCARLTDPIPTPEEKSLAPTSVYAITKRDHEEMFLSVGRAYGIPTVALRYFNAYGSRQALTNPYTGVLAIFSGRLLSGKAPVIYEDGGQSRDFVHVSDVVRANLLALEKPQTDFEVFNVGSGKATTVSQVAGLLIGELASPVVPSVTCQFREGDVRHCFADISRITKALGYRPRVSLDEGVRELVQWVRSQGALDGGESAQEELLAHGLVR
jgi:dTDP-L-rhamnose 4-epimerase